MNKTQVVIKTNIYQTAFESGDEGYIDGYVQAADSRGYAVVVRTDGYIDLCPVHELQAINLPRSLTSKPVVSLKFTTS